MFRIALPGLLVLAACGVINASIFDVEQWSLGVAVLGTPPNFGGVAITTITNPLETMHRWDGTDGFSSAATSYRFAWTPDYGDFLIQATHRAADVDRGSVFSTSEGSIYVVANDDLLFTVDGSYTYSLPIDPMNAGFGIQVLDLEAPCPCPELFAQARYVSTAFGAPLAGIASIAGQAVIPAGHPISISYGMRVDTSYGYTGQIAEGDGFIHFSLSEIPEPAAFLPLALGALALRRRR